MKKFNDDEYLDYNYYWSINNQRSYDPFRDEDIPEFNYENFSDDEYLGDRSSIDSLGYSDINGNNHIYKNY